MGVAVAPSTLSGVPRSPRSLLPDGVFHVTTHGVDDSPIYCDDEDRQLFVRLLHIACDHHDLECHAWCLMTTHYHVLVGATREKLSVGLRWLNGVYAQRFNRRYGRKGHLFGGRFWASVVEGDHHFPAAYRYILLNPVRAGLCDLPEQWRWSASPYGKEV
jgi:putative transposase